MSLGLEPDKPTCAACGDSLTRLVVAPTRAVCPKFHVTVVEDEDVERGGALAGTVFA